MEIVLQVIPKEVKILYHLKMIGDFTKPMKNMYTAYMFNILSNKKKVCSINGGHAKRALDGDYFMEKPSMGGDLPQPGLSVAVVQGLLQLVKA